MITAREETYWTYQHLAISNYASPPRAHWSPADGEGNARFDTAEEATDYARKLLDESRAERGVYGWKAVRLVKIVQRVEFIDIPNTEDSP